MHMTLEADYAVRIVEFLAAANQKVDARTISEETHVPLRFALKILRKLVAAGIVKSYKGTQGGYEIARPLEEISLRDVIETIEGPYNLSRCTSGNFTCNRSHCEGSCKFQKVFWEISQEVRNRLEACKFSDLV